MPPVPIPGQTFAGWRLLRLLGRGASSMVFLATPLAGSAPVALKLTTLPQDDASAQESFLRQARTVQRLSHPDIVALFDVGIDGDLAWLAMEPVPGTDLSRYARPNRLLPEPVVLRICERVAIALAYAHGRGLVHRDLKPSNVLVHLPSDTVKLADLGLARPAGAEATRTGIVPGSPAYMAPEQLAGRVPDERSDLYALGVTLFELLVGHLPHDAPTMGELLRRVVHDPAPDLRQLRPDLPASLAGLLARLLARDPALREADAAASAASMRAIRAELPARVAC